MFKKKTSSFFFVSKLFFCNFKISLPQTVLFMCVCVDVCETKRCPLFFNTDHPPYSHLDSWRNPWFFKRIQIDNVVRCVCVLYAACQILCNSESNARKKKRWRKKHFFLLCACVCLYVCCIVRLSLFLQNRPCESVLHSPLS